MRDLRASSPSLLAVILLIVAATVTSMHAQIDISQAANTACAVMSGQRAADRQTLQLLLLVDEGPRENNPVAAALQRQVLKDCPKTYQNYQQRKRGSNPFPAGSLVNSGGPLVKSPGPLVKPGGSLVNNSGGSLTRPGQGLIVSETERETRVAIAADLLFDFDKATIRPDAEAALKQAAAVIRKKNRSTVRIEGYTDSKGSNTYNMRLSNQRAVAVKTWLAQNEGFDIATFSTRGLGAAHPVASNTNPDGSDNPHGRQLNRRVELVIAK